MAGRTSSTPIGGGRRNRPREEPRPSVEPEPAPPAPASRWRRFARRPWRLAFLALLLAALGAIFLLNRFVVVERQVELELRATEGRVEIGLHPDADAMSPGCGCLDPSFGAHPWHGFGLPSTAFDLGVAAPRGTGLVPGVWALTAIVPPLSAADWYGMPDHTVQMRVQVRRDDRRRVLFTGRVTYGVLVLRGEVAVDHGDRFPYVTVIPAAGGTTAFATALGSRPQFGADMAVVSDAPERGDATAIFEEDRSHDPALMQRGPMIDVLGPRVEFTVPRATRLDVYAGLQRIVGIREGDEVRVSLRTPFALRLIPHPAPRPWLHRLEGWWSEMVVPKLLRDGRSRILRNGPTLHGRFVPTEPTPAFAARMQHVAVPDESAWRRFAAFSRRDGLVSPQLSAHRLDEWQTTYHTPPVTTLRQVAVFGRVTRLRSAAVRGRATVDQEQTPVARGQELDVQSDDGLQAGRYSLTPLVSAGAPTSPAAIDGRAKVMLDGEPLTKPPVLPWVVGVLGAALLVAAVTTILRWTFSEDSTSAR